MKKNIFLLLFLCSLGFAATAQKFPGLDKSPRDVAYYPNGFAHDRKEGDKAMIKVSYSRPYLKGRGLATLAPAGKVWRVGADESAEIKFYQDATFGGKKVKAGTYSLFAIPGEKEWTMILSSDLDYWGAYKYKESADVIRVMAPVTKATEPIENFGIVIEKASDKAANMYLGWANALVTVPVSF